MATIRLADPALATGRARDILDAILAREQRVFGASAISNVWRCMGHVPDYLEASWNRSRALMQRGAFPPVIRELIATAVSVANRCHY
jgi:alkylhydroperoxidase/carboxymuconolactone decarboxylase family protein YurZ